MDHRTRPKVKRKRKKKKKMYATAVTQESAAAIYGLTSKARCIAAQAPGIGADDEDGGGDTAASRSRFLIGTLSLREENEVHLIEVDDSDPDAPSVQEVGIFSHPGEVWALSPSPTDPALLFTSYDSDAVPKCTLWRIPADEEATGALVEVVSAKATDVLVKSVLWNTRKPGTIVLVDAHSVKQAVLDRGEVRETAAITRPEVKFTTARWCPMQENIVATANDTAVRGWDLRQRSASAAQQAAFSIDRSHADNVRDLDFNPNNPHYIATGGDDCRVRFWDVRNVAKPVKTLSGHSHWVWNVRYSPFHDELLISSGSDCKVVLWNVASISSRFTSAPSLPKTAKHEDDEPPSKLPPDGAIKVYEEHEDSVYGIAWGSSPSSSLWPFASLSYSGRVVINYVPREFADLTKYC